MEPGYTVFPARTDVSLDADWENPVWQDAITVVLRHFHRASSEHRPEVQAKLLYTADALYLRFHVSDRYVICRHVNFQDGVYEDSCVEFFVEPRPGRGYFNFEINCGGTLLLYYIEDSTRTSDGFARFTKVAAERGQQVEIRHSLPKVVLPERTEPVDWEVGCKIPLSVLEAYVGSLGNLPGQVWRANFYKCADGSSHPHWASWAPIGEELNFHQPRFFAPLRFVRQSIS